MNIDTVARILKAIGSFILGSLRIILFFGCILYTILMASSLMILVMAYNNRKFDEPEPDSLIDGLNVFILLGLVATGILGCLSSFFKHTKGMKVFTCLMLVISLVFMMSFAYQLKSGTLGKNEQLDEMRGYMPLYKWSWYRSPDGQRNAATIAWDKAQKLFCCGINGPDDWDSYRPMLYPADTYPPSCCIHYESGRLSISDTRPCTGDHKIFQTGCAVRFEQLAMFAIAAQLIVIGFQLALSALGYVVFGCCQEKKQSIEVNNQNGGDKKYLVNPHYEGQMEA